MDLLSSLPTNGLILLVAHHSILRDLTTTLTVQLALTTARSFASAKSAKLNLGDSVNVLDGGNRFDGLKLTRELRRHTRDYHAALSRVTIARAFTCYQMETLLAETSPGPTPTLVMELLTTFADENIALPERQRLLGQCLGHMEHLGRLAPSSSPPSTRPPTTIGPSNAPRPFPSWSFSNMGRTTASITQVFLEEKAAFARFRRALRRQDQLALDELFAHAQQHLAAVSYAAHALPFETFLLAMLLEESKKSKRQQQMIDDLRREIQQLQSGDA